MTKEEVENQIEVKYKHLIGKDIQHRNPPTTLVLEGVRVKEVSKENNLYEIEFTFNKTFISNMNGHPEVANCNQQYFDTSFTLE